MYQPGEASCASEHPLAENNTTPKSEFYRKFRSVKIVGKFREKEIV